MNPLLDSEFLVKLNNDKNRTIYAHVISLNQYEHPIEQIEGVVTAGSVTIDGQSAVRRICSLTLSAKNLNINNVYWGLTTKVKIEIGLQNNVEPKYDDIIWFPQGVFILTDFKTTQTVNNYTINLTGKDKGCLLNGDVSGNLPAPVRFDSYTDASNQSYTIGSSNAFAPGTYNNFIDDAAAEAILAGFTERYGSDYQFIRGAKKIISLQYTPKNKNQITGKIAFSQDEEAQDISDLIINPLSSDPPYDINLDDKDIYGFIVTGAKNGDQFTWVVEQKIPIAIIIQEMLHQFGQERYSNIIIRDIDPYALEMLDSNYKKPHYLLHNKDIYTDFITQQELLSMYQLYEVDDTGSQAIKTDEEGNISNIIFRNYVDEDDISLIEIMNDSTLINNVKPPTTIIKKGVLDTQYTVTQILQNEVAGYGMTLLVYPDELIGQPGESITSILDKIVNMMGDYEYFYDLNGQFIFQAKPAYIKTAWNKKIYFTDENYIDASELSKRVAYTFDDSALATQYQNTPNMNNIKNDYIIWGERKSLTGSTIKFHGRYAIDNPPLEYTDFNGYTWASNRKQSLITAIQKKQEEAKNNYVHIYNYPKNYEPEKTGWWEINDWANYYQLVFGIDLTTNGSMMQKYSQEKGYIKNEIDENNGIVHRSLLQEMLNYPSNIAYGKVTDVVVVVYTDATKSQIKYVSGHGTCVHYYAQFMDLRKLNKGWGYSSIARNEMTQSYSIINSWDPNKKYVLENNQVIYEGYHPDYTTSFIYRPILPDELSNYSDEIILNTIYTDTQNMNGNYRQYAIAEDVDWRHLIHIMADDWYQHHTEDDYEINLRKNNSWPDLNIDLFPYGRTGFEQYYLDFTSIGGFWQDLYNIYSILVTYYDTHSDLVPEEIDENLDDYAKQQIIYNKTKQEQALAICSQQDYMDKFFTGGEYKYWNRDIVENPENLTFWFDFFKADEMGIGKFAVSVIGDRPKTINDSSIKTIIYRDTPDVIYCSLSEYQYYYNQKILKDGYIYIIVDKNGKGYLPNALESDDIDKTNFISNIKQNFTRSIRYKTVHDEADNMLYQYSYYNDTVSLNSVPIYYLQPNTIISTKDDLSKVTGYYVINKINISLAYNGMMQITAIKSPERIY